jgi:hypothetical protein
MSDTHTAGFGSDGSILNHNVRFPDRGRLFPVKPFGHQLLCTYAQTTPKGLCYKFLHDSPSRHFPSCRARATYLDRTFGDRQRGPDACTVARDGRIFDYQPADRFRLSLTVDVSAIEAGS